MLNSPIAKNLGISRIAPWRATKTSKYHPRLAVQQQMFD
jgi:hypothetical protein